MNDQQQQDVLDRLDGSTVTSSDGEKVGKIADVYFDEQTGKPEWALVTTGLFAGKHSFVPLTNADLGDEVRLGVTKEQVTGAPNIDDDGELSQDEEHQLARHYGMQYSEAPSDTGLPVEGGAPDRGTARVENTTDDAMTRSEEELHVGTVRRPQELVRLRKRLVTEHVTKTVPVTREEVVVERETIDEHNIDTALDGPELTESTHEVVLSQDEVVVDKKVVPKERVRLDLTAEEEQRQIDETITKEQIDVEREQVQGR